MFHSFSDALPVSQFRRPAHRAVRRPANPDDPAVRVHVHDVHDAGRQRAQLCREHPAGDGAESLAVQPVPAVRDGAGRHGNTRQHAARLHGWRRRNINSNWFIFLLECSSTLVNHAAIWPVCPGQWVISSTVVQTRRGGGLAITRRARNTWLQVRSGTGGQTHAEGRGFGCRATETGVGGKQVRGLWRGRRVGSDFDQ